MCGIHDVISQLYTRIEFTVDKLMYFVVVSCCCPTRICGAGMKDLKKKNTWTATPECNLSGTAPIVLVLRWPKKWLTSSELLPFWTRMSWTKNHRLMSTTSREAFEAPEWKKSLSVSFFCRKYHNLSEKNIISFWLSKIWLVVPTPLKNIRQNGNLPQFSGENNKCLKPSPRLSGQPGQRKPFCQIFLIIFLPSSLTQMGSG